MATRTHSRVDIFSDPTRPFRAPDKGLDLHAEFLIASMMQELTDRDLVQRAGVQTDVCPVHQPSDFDPAAKLGNCKIVRGGILCLLIVDSFSGVRLIESNQIFYDNNAPL